MPDTTEYLREIATPQETPKLGMTVPVRRMCYRSEA
jgi:hypothetical protein